MTIFWTSVVPKEQGWYWYRETKDGHDPVCLQIVLEKFGSNIDLFVKEGNLSDETDFLENYKGEWSTKIPLPKETSSKNTYP